MSPVFCTCQFQEFIDSVLNKLLEFSIRLDPVVDRDAVCPTELKIFSILMTPLSASLTVEIRRARMSAAISSSLGIVIGVKGATLLFEATRLVM